MYEDNDKEFFRYKYLSFGDDKKSLNVIKEGTLKFTCPLEFNDPFDCLPYINMDNFKDKEIFKKALELDSEGLNNIEREKIKKQMIDDITNRVKNGEFTDLFLKDIGVLSLSRRYNSTLMWSHYADYHRGFAVGFRYRLDEAIEDEHDVREIIPRVVKYSKNRPIYTPAYEPFDMSSLLTKDEEWDYEEEERAFTWKEKPGIHEYDRAKRLHCVIAGAKISNDDLVLLKNSVQQASKELGRKIKFKQARLSEKTYDLEFVDIKYKYKK